MDGGDRMHRPDRCQVSEVCRPDPREDYQGTDPEERDRHHPPQDRSRLGTCRPAWVSLSGGRHRDQPPSRPIVDRLDRGCMAFTPELGAGWRNRHEPLAWEPRTGPRGMHAMLHG